MIASRRPDLKLTLRLCFAILLGLAAWLAALLLSQLALMEPVTAPAAQSLADNGGALRFVAASAAEANYASARLWVWFCIGANGVGAVLAGLWLREALRLSATPAPRPPAAQPAPRGNLIERAMHGDGARSVGSSSGSAGSSAARNGSSSAGADSAARATMRSRPAPAAPCSGEAAARLARVARIIDNLAFQTTLLAVNAAVEAARGSRMPPRA